MAVNDNYLFHEIISVIVNFVCGGLILFPVADLHVWNCNTKMRSVISFHGHCKHRNISHLSTFRPIFKCSVH